MTRHNLNPLESDEVQQSIVGPNKNRTAGSDKSVKPSQTLQARIIPNADVPIDSFESLEAFEIRKAGGLYHEIAGDMFELTQAAQALCLLLDNKVSHDTAISRQLLDSLSGVCVKIPGPNPTSGNDQRSNGPHGRTATAHIAGAVHSFPNSRGRKLYFFE
jgi:hypothetical protein